VKREDVLDRRTELLCDLALVGLDGEERAELESLQANDDASFDFAAAAAALAALGEEALEGDAGDLTPQRGFEPMPQDLRAAIAVQGRRMVEASARLDRVSPLHEEGMHLVTPGPRRDWARLAGWLAAAVFLAVAVWALLARPTAPVAQAVPSASALVRPATPTEAREELLRSAKDAVVLPWSATKDPAAGGASGDVVWSNAEQRGYMRFHGLPPNDPRIAQFQLWIFDKGRDERFPVDGGVFDVDTRTGDVVVPITARLHVGAPALFAVTVEPPGGVVVSKREHIVLTAAPRSAG
jgi:hypothetical protein